MTKTTARQKTIEHEVVPPKTRAVVQQAPPAPITPADMLSRAMETGNIELIERFMGLYKEWRASEAKQAFDNAIADAKGKFPKIQKTKKVGFDNKTGGKTAYKHEGLDDIAVIDPILSAHGLSWRHRTTQDADQITVTCIISHRDGYAEETSLRAASDKTGGKNDIQAIGSTVRYLTRYTLMLALGLAATDATPDDDGKAAGGGGPLSTAHLAEIKRLCDETDTDYLTFATYMEAETLDAMPDSKFMNARGKLLHKKRVQAKVKA